MEIEKNNSNMIWAYLSSGDCDDPGCDISLNIFGYYIRQSLPQWVLLPHYWTTQGYGGGAQGMVSERQYGLCFNEDHFSFRFGVNEDESYYENAPSERYWSCFMPWKSWEFARHDIYTPEGNLFSELEEISNWKDQQQKTKDCPKTKFTLKDFDDQEVIATCMIEEREWRLGTGPFKWLRFLSKPKINRCVDISFSEETGREKGSWKGGTTGCSCPIEEGQSIEDALRVFSGQKNMTFIGKTTGEPS